MSELSASLRAQAERCRRLAAATYDQETHESLNRSADEFEEQAVECDNSPADDPRLDQPDD